MSTRLEATAREAKEQLYNRITGDEDARVCKDIPDSACRHQPHNFFGYLIANLLGKIADEIASARLVIPWLFGSLGVPAVFTGFLVPIREAGVLLPQLAVAAAVRRLAIRKRVWVVGAVLTALSLFGMAAAAGSLQGSAAGWLILLMVVLFSLARGLCSVAAKDVLGKTISKSRRGVLMGWSASLSGMAILGIGIWLGTADVADAAVLVFSGLFVAGGVLWLVAALAFASIKEHPGATEGGGNALSVAISHLRLLNDDHAFRRFVIARAMLLAIGLASPFYVLIAQQQGDSGLLGLGTLIIANGLATSLSAPFWGRFGDRSSRLVMALAAACAGVIGVFVFAAILSGWSWATGELGLATVFFLFSVMHGGVRLGRKVYLVDMANSENRAAYVAVSNTVIGLLMLAGGVAGLVSEAFGAPVTVLLLGFLSFVAAFYALSLPEVSEPQ